MTRALHILTGIIGEPALCGADVIEGVTAFNSKVREVATCPKCLAELANPKPKEEITP